MSQNSDVLYVGFLLGHAGDALQMLDLAEGVASRGARVRIVVPELRTTVQFAERCATRGLPVVRSPWITADMTQSRQSLLSLIRLFLTYRASVVHIHTGDGCLPRLSVLAMDLLRMRRVFVTLQSPYDTLDPAGPRARFWAKAVGRRVHRVACPSSHGRATQIRYGVPEDRLAVVRNSVDVARYGGGNPAAARAALGVGPDVPLVVFTSRIDSQKRPVEAVQAFARAMDKSPDALLVFVGSGAEEANVGREAERLGVAERVRMAGYQSNVPDWLAAATVWILPTESENFSLAVLEAMAAGCPILSTLCPGNDEVLRDGQNSVAVKVGDVDAMASGLSALLTDEALRSRVGAAAREQAARYSVDRMVDEYAALYGLADEALSSRLVCGEWCDDAR